jgi:glycosyltransferase involved in cell wall biosynthesis
MRVGIDGYNLAIPTGTGVATYGATLANVLMDGGHQVEGVFGLDPGRRKSTRELFFFDRYGHGHRVAESKMHRKVARATAFSHLGEKLLNVPLTENIDRRQFGFRFPSFDAVWSSAYLFEIAFARFHYLNLFTTVRVPNPPKVMHWTYPLPLRMAGTKNIYTLHDLVPLKLPHTTLDDKRYYRRLIHRCLRYADHIATVSEASRDDILSLFKISPDKVSNTYQSSPVPPELLASSPEEDAEIVRSTFGLEREDYYLYFGAVDPKKNIGRIIDAYLSSRTDKKLVLVSSRSWGMDWETRMLGKGDRVYGRKLGKRVLRLEYLPRPTLFRVIRSAKAVLCPSLYEGFGLPALESLQLGTPVIGSNVSSLPEVIGDAGLLVNPYKTDQIAAAIRALDTDPELCARLRAAGQAQVAKYTSAAYLERLGAMYAKLGLSI